MGDQDMNNATLRSEWIDQEIEIALVNGYDGVNLDYEGMESISYYSFKYCT